MNQYHFEYQYQFEPGYQDQSSFSLVYLFSTFDFNFSSSLSLPFTIRVSIRVVRNLKKRCSREFEFFPRFSNSRLSRAGIPLGKMYFCTVGVSWGSPSALEFRSRRLHCQREALLKRSTILPRLESIQRVYYIFAPLSTFARQGTIGIQRKYRRLQVATLS